MTRSDGDTRHLDDLASIAHALITELVTEARWKGDAAYGPVATEHAGRSSNVASNPTLAEAVSRQTLRKRHGQVMSDLRWLVDRKLPQMIDRLQGADDRPLNSDDERDAKTDGGLSAYRGDRKAPAGRPELRDALDAQRRRLARGQGYGRG